MAREDIKCKISEDRPNRVFDEKGSMILAMRTVQWGNGEPKLELRKWFVGMEGDTPSKGFSFLTEDGPHNLTEALVAEGYGNTKKILDAIKDRPDFNTKITLEESIVLDDSEDEEYYDPKQFLL